MTKLKINMSTGYSGSFIN